VSYDAHITRAEFWANYGESPIPLDEWIRTASGDERLQARGDRLFVAEKIRTDGDDAAFTWFKGEIYTRDPDNRTIALMSDLANELGASLQDDDGEDL
jgi:hypothetical protein